MPESKMPSIKCRPESWGKGGVRGRVLTTGRWEKLFSQLTGSEHHQDGRPGRDVIVAPAAGPLHDVRAAAWETRGGCR